MKHICFTIAIILNIYSIYSQTPTNDNSWVLINSNSDEFNGSLSNIWLGGVNHPQPDWRSSFKKTYIDNICVDYPFHAFRTNANRAFTDNNQSFRMITSLNNPPILVSTLLDGCCCFDNNCGGDWCTDINGVPACSSCDEQSTEYLYSTSPWLLSINAIKYGFFEARLRCTDVGLLNHNGFGANFWLTSSGVNQNYDNIGNSLNIVPNYSEIDALEFISWDENFNSPSNHMYTLNSHYEFNNVWIHEGAQFKGNVGFTSGTYHTFAVEWTPTYIKYYFDDNLMHVSSNHPSLMLPQRVVLDINAFTNSIVSLPNANTIPNATTPYNFDIDYIRVYRLRNSMANIDWSDCSFSPNYTSSLYKSITFGQPGCSGYTLSAGQYRTLRAVDFIEINQAFTAELGSVLTLETMPYHVQTIINVISN